MSSNEAADQVVSMTLKGIEVMARITGLGAKNLATYLYAALRDQKRTRGKTRLEGLLRSGKELKVFAVRNEELRKFTEEAKRYGVLYCALRDKKNLDGMCDIMVRAEDASKINRIVERFKLATVDTASIKREIERSRATKQTEKAPAEKATPAEKSTEGFLDDILVKPGQPQPEAPQVDNPNPMTATAEKPLPSEPISGRSERSAEGMSEPERRSVRQELKKIRESRKEQTEPKKVPAKERAGTGRQSAPPPQHKPRGKKPKKGRQLS